MLSKAEIEAASAVMDVIDQSMWITLIRASVTYRTDPLAFPAIDAKIAEIVTERGVRAKQLNALAIRIGKISQLGTTKKKGGQLGVDYDAEREREALVLSGMSVIWPAPTTGVIVGPHYAIAPIVDICMVCHTARPCGCAGAWPGDRGLRECG